MASINFELCELVDIVKSSVKMPSQIRQIGCENDKIKITVDPGRLSPSFNVFLTYDKFDNGKILFNVNSRGPIKLMLSMIDTVGLSTNNDIWDINSRHFSLDINDYLKSKFNFVKVKDIVNEDDRFSIII